MNTTLTINDIDSSLHASPYGSDHMVGACLSSGVRLVNQLQFRLNINLSCSTIILIEATVARSVLSCCDVIPTSLCGCGSQDYCILSIEKECYYLLEEEEESQETHTVGGQQGAMRGGVLVAYWLVGSIPTPHANSTTHNKEDEVDDTE